MEPPFVPKKEPREEAKIGLRDLIAEKQNGEFSLTASAMEVRRETGHGVWREQMPWRELAIVSRLFCPTNRIEIIRPSPGCKFSAHAQMLPEAPQIATTPNAAR